VDLQVLCKASADGSLNNRVIPGLVKRVLEMHTISSRIRSQRFWSVTYSGYLYSRNPTPCDLRIISSITFLRIDQPVELINVHISQRLDGLGKPVVERTKLLLTHMSLRKGHATRVPLACSP
jgi:hypothetical protein